VCRPRYETGSTTAVTGYSVAVAGAERPVWYGGGRLGRDLALPRLRAGWEPVVDQRAAWANKKLGREATKLASPSWTRVGEETRRLVEDLVATAVGDRLAWAQAARDGAGVSPPGPSDSSPIAPARCRGRPTSWPAPPRRRSGLRCWASRRLLALAAWQPSPSRPPWGATAPPGGFSWPGELVRLVEALERAHAARGELTRAADLASGAGEELAAWGAQHQPAPAGATAAPERKPLVPGLGGMEGPLHPPGPGRDGPGVGR